jgi:uncharacterized membrane protein
VVSVTLQPQQLQVTPGTAATCELRVQNRGTVTDEFEIVTSGPAGWTRSVPDRLRLAPDATGTATIQVLAPRTPETRAGTSSLAVVVTSTADAAVTARVDAAVVVGEFSDLRGQLVPTAAHGRGTIQHRVDIWNMGGARETVSIGAAEPGNRLTIQASPGQLDIEPGASASARVAVTVLERAGEKGVQREDFGVVLRSARATAPVRLQGTRTWKRSGRGRGCLLAALLAIGGIILLLLIASNGSR